MPIKPRDTDRKPALFRMNINKSVTGCVLGSWGGGVSLSSLFRLVLNSELVGVYYPRVRVSVWIGLMPVNYCSLFKVLATKKPLVLGLNCVCVLFMLLLIASTAQTEMGCSV
jgi:hypothetical protein